jgi:hypothetical protein
MTEKALRVTALQFDKSPMGEFERFVVSWQQESLGGSSAPIPSKAKTEIPIS